MASPPKKLSTKRYQAYHNYLVSGGVVETVKKHSFVETLQSVKVREGSVKGNVKVKIVDTYVFKKSCKAKQSKAKQFKEKQRKAKQCKAK